MSRLFRKLPQRNKRAGREIRQSFDQRVGKRLPPPLPSLREESRDGESLVPLNAVDTLFQLKELDEPDGRFL